MTDLIHRSRKRSLSALAVFGVCGAFSPHDSRSRLLTARTRRDVQTHSSPRTHHHHHYNHIPTAWRGGKARYKALNMIGKRGPIPIIDSADLDEKQQIDDDDNDNDMNIAAAAATTTTKKKKPKIKFDLLPDFMQKDPLMITKQRWIDETTIPIDIDEENARSKREKNEMMIMSVASLALAVGVIYALASSAPEIVLPSNEEVKELENAGRDLIRIDTSAQLELATRNIVGQVLPNSAEDAIAVTIGEGIAGVIGAFATWLLGLALNFKSDDDFTSDRRQIQMGGGMQDMDALYSEAVADGDYFLTRAAAQPLLEALGIPIFFASFASVIIATVPYEAVKLSSQKRRDDVQQQQLLEMLLEEEETRQGNMNAIDKVGNNIFEFINRLNVRANNFDDDIENEIEEEEDQVSDITELQKEQLKNAAPALDYVELFADLTKWLEYDVLITNYRGVLALPNGQMLSSGWESAIFGLLAALSSQLYTDVLYLYSDFGNPIKREKTLNRSIEGWTGIYATKCLSAATLFGVYEAVRGPTSNAFRKLVSGGTGGCVGSKDFDLCMETYLMDNPPSPTIGADFRATMVSIFSDTTNWLDNFSYLLPLNDQETLNSFFRGVAVSVYSELLRLFEFSS